MGSVPYNPPIGNIPISGKKPANWLIIYHQSHLLRDPEATIDQPTAPRLVQVVGTSFSDLECFPCHGAGENHEFVDVVGFFFGWGGCWRELKQKRTDSKGEHIASFGQKPLVLDIFLII